MEIGILGGSFNPIHFGHLHVAKEVLKRKNLDKVILVPSSIPPHKDSSQLLPASLRFKMVEQSIQNEPQLEASSIEIHRPGVSYTIDTLREFEKLYPDSTLYFIIGSDMMEGLPTWKKIHSLIQDYSFLIVQRPGYPIYWDKLHSFSSEEIQKLKQGLLEIKAIDISSSLVRKALEEGKSLKNFVPQEAILLLETYGKQK